MKKVTAIVERGYYDIPSNQVKLVGLKPCKPKRFKVSLCVSVWRGPIQLCLYFWGPDPRSDSCDVNFNNEDREDIPLEKIPNLFIDIRALYSYKNQLEDALNSVLGHFFVNQKSTRVVVRKKGHQSTVTLFIEGLKLESSLNKEDTEYLFNGE